MRKIIGLCMVLLVSSTFAFAQDGRGKRNRERVERDPAKRYERLAERLSLDEKQMTEFKKMDEQFAEKMKSERDEMKAQREKQFERMTAMRTERDTEVKKILSEEQYKLYADSHRFRDRDSKERSKDRGDKFRDKNRHHRSGGRR